MLVPVWVNGMTPPSAGTSTVGSEEPSRWRALTCASSPGRIWCSNSSEIPVARGSTSVVDIGKRVTMCVGSPVFGLKVVSTRVGNCPKASAPSGARPTNSPALPLIVRTPCVVQTIAEAEPRRERRALPAQAPIETDAQIELQTRVHVPQVPKAEPSEEVVGL